LAQKEEEMAFKTLSKQLEKWAETKVPILRTYLKQENLRDADKLIRDELVKRLEAVKDRLEDAKAERVDNGSLLHLDKLDRACSKIDQVRESIRFAARGYRGLFDPQEVSEDDLVNLLNFDEQLFGVVEALDAEAQKVAALGDDALLASLRNFEKQVTAFDQTLGEREKYASDKLPAGPPGAGGTPGAGGPPGAGGKLPVV
jgi:hypothetical protein